MLVQPNIDPVALDLGFVQIHWYGIMYLLGFAGALILLTKRSKNPQYGFTAEQVSDMIFYGALGVVLGGRVGYILFYNFSAFLDNPIILFQIYKGGMSFHGGLLGVIIAIYLYGRKINKSVVEITDFGAPAVPLGLFFGRFANFINGELYGRVTDVPWGMVFRHGGPLPRHPSMLYEMFLEGFVLFCVLWWFSRKPRPKMMVSGLFLLLYGCFRFSVEFVRQPDPQLGFIAFGWLTQGMLLSSPMILLGAGMIFWAKRKQ